MQQIGTLYFRMHNVQTMSLSFKRKPRYGTDHICAVSSVSKACHGNGYAAIK